MVSEKTKRRRLSFKEKYELITEVKAGVPKEFLLLGVQISFEGLTKDGPPTKPSKLICTPNK